MSKISLLLLTALFFISSSAFAISTSDKAVSNAKKKTADFVQVVDLSATEEAQVYEVLLAKEQKNLALKIDYKDNKEAYKAAMKPFNKKYNRQIKDIVGKDKMKKMNQYYKAQRSADK